MYYEDGATQAEIAEALGVSRPLISKYLARARETGIVQIQIHDEISHPYASIETTLEKKYQLREAIVVSETGEQSVKRNMGMATGNYLLRIAKKDQIIGVSSGTTLYEVANQMPNSNLHKLTIVPLVGGLGDERIDVHANQIVVKIATRLKAEYKLLHAPVAVDSSEAKSYFMRQTSIADIIELGKKSDIAIVGIGGSPEYSTMVQYYMANQHELNWKEADVVGDICFNFINSLGESAKVSWNDRIIALSLNDLRKIPIVIGVAHGQEKVSAIHSALLGKLIHVLVTDDQTALKLLDF